MTGKKFRPIHKASKVQELPQPASPEGGEDRRPPIPVRDSSAAAEDRSRQPEGQRGEWSHAEAGRNTLRCLQLRSDQQWEEESRLNHHERFQGRTRGSHLPESKANRGPRDVPRSQNSTPAPHAGEQRRRPSSGRHTLSRPSAGRTGHGSDKEAQAPETKPSKQHQKGLLLHPKQKGTAERPPRMQKQPQLPYSMTAPRDEDPDRFTKNLEGPEQQAEMEKQHSPQNEESLLHTFQRQREAGRQQQSPHLPAAHAWLASRSLQTASGQIREAAAPVTASGHENGERDCVTATGHSDHPGEQGKATAVTGSGQTTATGHARTISEGPVAVRKPPLATPKPLERTQ